jgi:hypothetical protein
MSETNRNLGKNMFKVGNSYDIEMLDGEDQDGNPCVNTYPNRKVTEINFPLIKINSSGKEEIIINTHSSIFVRAKLR